MSILSMTHKVEFKTNASYSERESLINTEILKIQDTLRQRGFYLIEHKVLNKNDKNATIGISYKV